jgi:hypothetical protein
MSLTDLEVVHSALAPFSDIEQTGDKQAILDAIIDRATRLQRWPLVEAAIAAKVEEQIKFVEWWEKAVSPRGRPEKIAVQRSFSVADAEMRTGIRDDQVSRWRKRKADPQKYIDQQILAGWQVPMRLAA